MTTDMCRTYFGSLLDKMIIYHVWRGANSICQCGLKVWVV